MGGGGAVVGYKVAYSYKNGMVGNRNQKAGKRRDLNGSSYSDFKSLFDDFFLSTSLQPIFIRYMSYTHR